MDPKLNLDLFKDRLAVYSKVLEAVRMVERQGYPEGHEPFNLLHEARDEAQFLFGPEVAEYIKNLISATALLQNPATAGFTLRIG